MTFRRASVPTPQERRERNREEMSAAILDAARAIMREDGAGALNLNDLARWVNLTTPALYSYFPNKMAIYDTLYRQTIASLRERDGAIWQRYEPGWDLIRAWFATRLEFALEHPELYHLCFSSPVPGFEPSPESVAETQKQVALIRDGVNRLIDAGVIDPGIPAERARDLLLAVRHGIVAERVGKANVVPADSSRFENLIDDALSVLKAAWTPRLDGSHGKETSG
jgi:AcrR family transcriptional regulator